MDAAIFPREFNRADNKNWTHYDRYFNINELQCYQSFVSLTDNEQRCFVVYDGSHLIQKEDNPRREWRMIDVDAIQDSKIVITVKAGDMVIWDSRCYHQSQYGTPGEILLV
jgi:hypothetical protein